MFEITEAREFIEQKMKEYQIFDHYRIVDTDTYLIHRWDAGEAVSQAYRCYEIWNHNSSCENCISKRAVEECRQIIKLETLHGKVFLIAALPAPELGPRLAIELIQDVTDSFHINVGNHQENMSMADLIQKMNDMAIRDSYTGLYNKQFLEHELHRQTLRWAASTPLVIVLSCCWILTSLNMSMTPTAI